MTSFRFNLSDGTSYDLIYACYGVKNGELKSAAGGFKYFTSADIGSYWNNLNTELEAIPMVRHEYLLTQPLTKDDIRAEAARILSAFQAARGPNSPSGTHFMVQVSPDFLARANSKNQNRLVSMLPFRSLSISTLEGRKGVYALITKDEDRAQSLRLRKPSVRKKLSETKAEPGHTDKKKVREQER